MPGPAELPEESPCVQQIPSSLKEAEFTSLFLFLAPSSLRAASCSSCPPCGFLSLVLHAAGAEPQTRDHLPVPPPLIQRSLAPPRQAAPHFKWHVLSWPVGGVGGPVPTRRPIHPLGAWQCGVLLPEPWGWARSRQRRNVMLPKMVPGFSSLLFFRVFMGAAVCFRLLHDSLKRKLRDGSYKC